jgi:L-fuculokinase
MAKAVVAVFDIGKINKKFLLFDQQYQLVYAQEESLEQTLDDDGDPCEDLSKLTGWIRQTLDDAIYNDNFTIKALNFATYGASLVHLNKRGTPAAPLYSYLKEIPEAVAADFYARHGGEEEITRQTCSPPLGMLNSGLQLYWLKYYKPELFRKIRCSVHLPQYCSYIITNLLTSEITSLGCHTALWNFEKKNYHDWVLREQLHTLFPPLYAATTRVKIPLGAHQFVCGIGIHDSSATLIPYFISEKEPFVVLSTGTWSIALNPYSEDALTADELSRDCLTYLNSEGKPTKASRLFLGNEFYRRVRELAVHFRKPEDYHTGISFNPELVRRLLADTNPEKRFYPETEPLLPINKMLPVSRTNLALFETYEEAYHRLNMDLAAMQAAAVELVRKNTPMRKLFVSGGFSGNAIFLKLLASHFPEIEVYTATMPDASALGAAMLLHPYWNPVKEPDHLFTFNRILPDKAIIPAQSVAA